MNNCPHCNSEISEDFTECPSCNATLIVSMLDEETLMVENNPLASSPPPSPYNETIEAPAVTSDEAKTVILEADPEDDDIERKYEFKRLLGSGGFAEVYLVLNRSLDRYEAVKLLHPKLTTDADVRKRFLREAKTIAQLDHPNIITIFEVGELITEEKKKEFGLTPTMMQKYEGRLIFFSMQFVNGEACNVPLDNGTVFEESKILRIMTDVLSALDFAHKQQIIHRDIKPDNIMVDASGRSIVMDFGIAKALESNEKLHTKQTAMGTFLGTAKYVSPEQAQGMPVDARSDIYSLGITMFEMLTGRAPFESDEWITLLMSHVNAPIPNITDYSGEISPAINRIIHKALAKNPAERFQNSEEFAIAIGKLQGNNPDVAATAPISGKTQISDSAANLETEFISLESSEMRRIVSDATEKPKSKKGLLAIPIIAVIAIAGYFGYIKPSMDESDNSKVDIPKVVTTPNTTTILEQSIAFSSFPQAKVSIVAENKDTVLDFTNGTSTPFQYQLPHGKYTIEFANEGLKLKESIILEVNETTSPVHLKFKSFNKGLFQ